MSNAQRATLPLFLLIGIMMIAVFMWHPSPSVAQGTQVAAVSIDGDVATRIATSAPGATVQVVAGSDGLYRREAGEEWARAGDAPGDGAIVFAADSPDLMLSGDHPPCLRGGDATLLSRTEDGGETWTTVAGATDIRPLAVWADTGIAIGSSCAGFMLSMDAGLTWAAIEAAEPGFEITSSAVVSEPAGTDGPVVLFGETSEGGSSRLRTLDLADPGAPIVSGALREYFGIAALAARGDVFAIAAIDGVWLSTDAGASWTRSAEGLEPVVLAEDPAVAGLPAGVAMDEIGLFALAMLPGTEDGLVIGSARGLYVAKTPGDAWASAADVAGRVDQIGVSEGDDRLLLLSEDRVFETTLDR